jgi:hypothetical protein
MVTSRPRRQQRRSGCDLRHPCFASTEPPLPCLLFALDAFVQVHIHPKVPDGHGMISLTRRLEACFVAERADGPVHRLR